MYLVGNGEVDFRRGCLLRREENFFFSKAHHVVAVV